MELTQSDPILANNKGAKQTARMFAYDIRQVFSWRGFIRSALFSPQVRRSQYQIERN